MEFGLRSFFCFRWLTLLFVCGLLSLEACNLGGSLTKDSAAGNQANGSGGGRVDAFPLGTAPTTALADVELRFSAVKVPSRADSVVFENKPLWMTVDSETGEIVGTPNEGAKTYKAIIIHISRGPDTDILGPFDLTVLDDPLKKEAWHLGNTGQKSFSQSAGTVGFDLNLTQTIAHGHLGQGVTVAVSDSGTEYTHEDLLENYVAAKSRDYRLGVAPDYTGSPFDSNSDVDTEPSHGTSVAGTIAAVGWNGKGSRGVAPQAKFAAFNFVPAENAVHNPEMGVTYLNQATGAFDVFNQSWGSAGAYFASDGDYVRLLGSYNSTVKQQVATARAGKGSLMVRAAGNEFIYPFRGLIDDSCPPQKTDHFRDYPETNNYFTINSNLDSDNVLPYSVVVGALDADAVKASYSSMGSDLWVAAPSGEFGDLKPATVTVDRMGCTKGFSLKSTDAAESASDKFNFGLDALNNPNCNYTNAFNGTSAAAPMVTGSVALLLSANPELTWRDVKYILAKTAAVVESNLADKVRSSKTFKFYRYSTSNGTCSTIHGTAMPSSAGLSDVFSFALSDPAGYVAVEKWKTNAAGFHFHNYYGFGKVNVDAAVELATNHYVSPFAGKAFKEVIVEDSVNLAIPNAGASGSNCTATTATGALATYSCLEVPITVSENLEIEAVRVKVMIDASKDVNSSYPGEIGIELVSPSGTLSKLQLVNNAHMGAQIEDAQLGPSNQVDNSTAPGGVAYRDSSFEQYFETQFPGNGFPMLSNAFFMEPTQKVGKSWTLRIIDGTKTNFAYSWNGAVEEVLPAKTPKEYKVTSQTHTFTHEELTGVLKGYSISFFGHDL